MPEQQLVDYIKKAKEAGQSDDQTKSMLVKNGWTDAEVGEAFAAVGQPMAQPRPQPQVQTQPTPEPQVQAQVQVQPQPQPQPKMQQQPVQVVNIPAERKSHALLGVLVALIIIVVGGVGTFVVGQFINIPYVSSLHITLPWGLGNLVAPSPESVILRAWNNLSVIKSENFNSELSLTSDNIKTNQGGGSLNFDLKASGGVDNTNINDQLADINVFITASAIDTSGSGVNSNLSLSLAGEARLIQKDLYLQLNTVDLGGLESLLTMFGLPNPNDLKGQWIRFQNNDAIQQDISKQVQAVSGQQAAIDQNSKDAANKIVKILFDKKTYDISQLADNQGSEGAEYHYLISPNQQKIIAASPEIFSELKDYYAKANPGKPLPVDYTLENLQKGINDAFAKVGNIGVNIFIGKSDNFFHKIQITKVLDVSKLSSTATGIITLNFQINQTGINKPLQVSAPANYTDFQNLIPASAVKSDMSKIATIAQSVFSASNSYASLCMSGLLNGYLENYGTDLVSLNNDVIIQGANKPLCLSSVTDYCVSTQLADGSYLCVDRIGVVGKTKCLSAMTICK